ncbi:tryptophan halogenase family protein [Paucibacter sp. APW11]|uniref:Tryptophan halogenase family protein n=1 Tax=Roseateles aquae TaxID=3077235 RepID=A0ABU3PBH6_9BURK|nr:tryptophan halogenase family protein [Paucibacter sp. APW11]MDT8999916.1 tryptophan halogenase family protein [Paucibacter sp. APW11]
MKILKIAIIGGGTAGWLAANHLGREMHADPAVQITVIESDEVPIIGVGEGTVPAIKGSLRKFGISEAELLLHCETTFKAGIKFQNWLDEAVHGPDHFYYHPFASAYPGGLDASPFCLQNSAHFPFSDVSVAARVAEAMRSPKQIASGPYEGEVDYAYHVNAHQFAGLLARNAQQRFGVTHRVATITGAERDAEGNIACLVLKSGEREAYDFYIDCSGFASLLTHRTLKVPFVDKSNQILTDTALVQQVPTAHEAEIPPYTLATAHRAGWIWDIPVTERRGTGFVYASQYMQEDEAVAAFARYLGRPLEGFAPRKIAMKIGYRQQAWTHNCVALGLAQGFVEPLEATSILLTDFAAGLLARNFPRWRGDAERLRPHVNQVLGYAWERIIDFVQMHYHVSDRNDSAFWRDNRFGTHVSELLRERLDKWRIYHPQQTDFSSRFDLFGVENYLYVLYGMRFATRGFPISEFERSDSHQQLERIRAQTARLVAQLPSHRDWLNGLREAARAQQIGAAA